VSETMLHPAHIDAIGRPPDLDLGDNHLLWFTQWAPDRALNPQFALVPDVPRWGAIVSHLPPSVPPEAPVVSPCYSGVTFHGPVQERIAPEDSMWTVESLDPLTLSPSLLCRACGDHGFIRAGRWVRS